jgi:hypothetical protein
MTDPLQPPADALAEPTSGPPTVDEPSTDYLDDEITNLLNQAESLTGELAHEFNGDFEAAPEPVEQYGTRPDDGLTPATHEFSPDAASVDESSYSSPVAQAASESSVASVEATPSIESSSVEPRLVVEPAKAKGPDLRDLLNDPEAEADNVEVQPVSEMADPAIVREPVIVETASDVYHREAASEVLAGRAEAIVDAVRESEEVPPADSTEEIAPTDEILPLNARAFLIIGKIGATWRIALRAILGLPLRVIAIPVHLLVLFDQPFSRIGKRPRRIIGLFALATTVCAILAWVLPWLLTTNPFAQMPTGIVTDR